MSDLSRFNLAFTAVLGFLVFTWGLLANFQFPPLTDYIFTTILTTIFGLVAWFYTHIRRDISISGPCWSLFILLLILPISVMYSYLIHIWNFPLADVTFAEFDALFGFNWLVLAKYFATLPEWVSTASTKIYTSWILLIQLTALFLIVSGRHKRLDEFVFLFLVTITITCTISGFLPGVGAFDYFKPDAATADKLSAVVGAAYYDDLLALRDGSLRTLTISSAHGLVTVPSFHTINSLILIYVMRGCGKFLVLAVIWNLAIIATTPFDGAHYLADIVGGVIVAIIGVYLLRWIEPRVNAFYARPVVPSSLSPPALG